LATQTQPFSIACDDQFQQRLNDLYEYQDDILTKVYHRSRIALFQRLLKSLIKNGTIREFGKAFDIGCNAGFYSKLISDFGFRDVFGVDISDKYVAKANNEFASGAVGKRISFKVMDASDLMERSVGQYDFILCTEVIEHTDRQEAVIDNIMNLLFPGGVAVISLPNCVSLGYFTSFVACVLRGQKLSKDLRDHLKFPFYKGPALFRARGAHVISTSGVNSLFNAPLLMFLHRSFLFASLNDLNFWLSSRWPCKCVAQFFFFVIRKDTSSA
jgi:2-polyprenyl-3-methyl-5-hydroxy-6-metoxy-1,4-benzoquinol methylase